MDRKDDVRATAVITGVAGFIGSTLAEHLLDVGVRVIGLDRFSSYYPRNVKERNLSNLTRRAGFDFYELDIARDEITTRLRGARWVFHLAAQPGVRGSWGDAFETYLRDNVLGTHRVLEACRQTPVDRVVVASSSSVYGNALGYPTAEDTVLNPVSPYGMTKLAVEQLCRQYFDSFGVPVVLLRYFTVYGPRQRPDMAFHRFITRALSGEPIRVFGDGCQVRDFTYVQDAVNATVLAATVGRSGEAYNISGGNQVSINEVLFTLESLLGLRPAVEYCEPVPGDAQRTGGSAEKARLELGFTPTVDLMTGLKRQIEWIKAGARATPVKT